MRFSLFVLSRLLVLSATPFAQASEAIWLAEMDDTAVVYKNAPGVHINGDTRRLLLTHMPNDQKNVAVVNYERAFQILKSHDAACLGNSMRTSEREEFAYFSALPQLIFPGLRLYMSEATAKAANLDAFADNNNRQSLAGIIAKLPRARLGIIGGRNYGEPLQPIFESLTNSNRLYSRAGSDMSAAPLLDMLVSGRLELIIEYPNVVQHYMQALNHNAPLFSVNITETAKYSSGFIMCSKTEQGRKLAQAYSDAIHLASKDISYLQAHLRWFDVSTHNEITTLYNQVYHTSF